FSVLVMSGYGIDALLSVSPTVRRLLLRRSLVVVVAGMTIAGLIEGALLVFKPLDADGSNVLQAGAVLDGVILAIGAGGIWLASRSARAQTCVLALTGFMVLSQVVYVESVYNFIGLSFGEVMRNFGLDDDDLKTPRAIGATDPNELRRKTCDTFPV